MQHNGEIESASLQFAAGLLINARMLNNVSEHEFTGAATLAWLAVLNMHKRKSVTIPDLNLLINTRMSRWCWRTCDCSGLKETGRTNQARHAAPRQPPHPPIRFNALLGHISNIKCNMQTQTDSCDTAACGHSQSQSPNLKDCNHLHK